ncbi:hypothetical protein HDV05_004040 [Chytridiales sp. JEL 0842]|nr:hypothetical protein HDV05_004040 [Chytridiales sp. JEL 0842]
MSPPTITLLTLPTPLLLLLLETSTRPTLLSHTCKTLYNLWSDPLTRSKWILRLSGYTFTHALDLSVSYYRDYPVVLSLLKQAPVIRDGEEGGGKGVGSVWLSHLMVDLCRLESLPDDDSTQSPSKGKVERRVSGDLEGAMLSALRVLDSNNPAPAEDEEESIHRLLTAPTNTDDDLPAFLLPSANLTHPQKSLNTSTLPSLLSHLLTKASTNLDIALYLRSLLFTTPPNLPGAHMLPWIVNESHKQGGGVGVLEACLAFLCAGGEVGGVRVLVEEGGVGVGCLGGLCWKVAVRDGRAGVVRELGKGLKGGEWLVGVLGGEEGFRGLVKLAEGNGWDDVVTILEELRGGDDV